jgi:cytoskeleton protein RodZ
MNKPFSQEEVLTITGTEVKRRYLYPAELTKEKSSTITTPPCKNIIENTALSLDTQTFRIFYHLPKNIDMNAMSTNASRFHEMNDTSQETNFSDLEANEEDSSEDEDLTLRGKELKENQVQEIIADKTKLGTYLRQTREQQGLSLQQVADKLFLNMHFVKAIESDDYSSLPSAVFVRGYLKNYAKLLGLSTEAVMEAYDVIGQGHTPSLSPQLSQKDQVNTNDPRFKALTAIIIIAFMVLVTLWNIYPNSSNPNDEITISPEELAQPFAGDNSSTYIPPTEGEDSLSTAKGVVQDAGQLVVHFKKETWVKVIDNENNKLYEGTGEAGKELPIVGKPPFKITAGNTDVAVEYQGEIIDLAKHHKKEEGAYIFGKEETAVSEQTERNLPLIVHFKQRAWLRIMDGNDKTLYDGIKKEGDKLTLNGTPPFKIKAGNVGGIEVEYGSKTVNLTNHTEKEGRLFIFGK